MYSRWYMYRFGVVIVGTIRDLNDVVDIAKEIMKKDKNIGWLVAIEEAKEIVFKDKEVKTDIDNGIVYDIETGESIIELWKIITKRKTHY